MQNTLLNQPQTQRLQSIQSRGNQSKTYLPHLPKVFILAILGLGIIVGINSGCGSTEKLDATVAGEIQASQVVDKEGFPLRESRIEIPFNGPVEIRGNEGLTFEALVRDPMDRKEKPRKLNILKTEVQGNSLILHVDGPVSNGSVLTLNKSGALAVNGKSVDSGSVKVRGTKLISPLEATLWFKPFEPSNVNLFTSSCYLNASPPLDLPPQPTDPVVVRRNLAAHFQNFVAQDKLTEKEVNALLARFDDPVQRKVFTDDDGVFQPHLMAMVLANAGTVTVTESAIETLIDGKNETGRPAKVVYGEPVVGAGAQVKFIDNRMVVIVMNMAKRVPFQVFAPSLGHEAFHASIGSGIYEEVTAKFAETISWAQQLLANPQLATLKIRAVRSENEQLLALLNSGAVGYPRPGLYWAPLGNSSYVMPGCILHLNSIYSFIDQILYPNWGGYPSTGNFHLVKSVSQITGEPEQWSASPIDDELIPGLIFDTYTWNLLDNVKVFTSEELFRLLEILQLRFSEKPEVLLALDENNLSNVSEYYSGFYNYGWYEEYDKAIEAFNSVISSNPKYTNAYFFRGLAYYKKGQYDQAIADLNKVIESGLMSTSVYTYRGATYHGKGQYDEAIADYTKAIELNPDNSTTYENRGLAYNEKGEYGKAIADFNKAIESGLMSTSVYFYRGSAYFFKDEYSKAIDDYTKAIELDANNSSVYQSSVYQLRGIAYYKKGEYDKAWEDVQKSQELGGEIDSEVLNVIREASGN